MAKFSCHDRLRSNVFIFVHLDCSLRFLLHCTVRFSRIDASRKDSAWSERALFLINDVRNILFEEIQTFRARRRKFLSNSFPDTGNFTAEQSTRWFSRSCFLLTMKNWERIELKGYKRSLLTSTMFVGVVGHFLVTFRPPECRTIMLTVTRTVWESFGEETRIPETAGWIQRNLQPLI